VSAPTTVTAAPPATCLPLTLDLPPSTFLYQNAQVSIGIHSGLTTLLGPNGAGKTQALIALRAVLSQKFAIFRESTGRRLIVRYLSAGRSAPLEVFRGSLEGPGQGVRPTTVGHINYVQQRHDISSLVGDYLALHERPDLRIKVEARLQTLFSKGLRLRWSQNGLNVEFVGKSTPYSASSEASGVVHLAGILAALYDDAVSALLIDEPEISLHPQWQRFLLEEIKNVSGDPVADATKKLIVISTHSLAMLSLRQLADVPTCVFFTGPSVVPKQLSPSDGALNSKALRALFARIGDSHRQAFFATTVLLVEGPSDEITAGALSSRLDIPLGASSAQVVPVLGKDEMVDTATLFRLIGKRVVILADLDALADDPRVLQSFADVDQVKSTAATLGFASVSAMDKALRSDLAEAVSKSWSEIEPLAASHRYLASVPPTPDQQKRAALAALLTCDPVKLPNDTWRQLRSRCDALLSVLAVGGCFFVRGGTIEDCFSTSVPVNGTGKPQFAASEATTFPGRTELELRTAYADTIEALQFAAPKSRVNETVFLRSLLAGILGSLFQRMETTTANDDLQYMAVTANPEASGVFEISNASVGNVTALQVALASPLFSSPALPATVRVNQNLTEEVAKLLPLP
jgi:AAA domain, putative AbiEii toxin, Type IV TA system